MNGLPGRGSPPAAVLLDIDDTLVDTRAAFTVAIDAMARRWLPHLEASGRADALAHWLADRHGSYRAYTRGEMTMEEQRRARVADMHLAFGGCAPDDAQWQAWDDAYMDAFAAAWRLRPGVVDLLDRLDEAGVAYGAVTNASRSMSERKLSRLGLDGRVRVLCSVDDTGVGKPAPQMFLGACEQVGCAPAEAAYVGDEWDIDALGAAQAGLIGVWLDALATPQVADRAWAQAVRAGESAGVPGNRLRRVHDLAELPCVLGIGGVRAGG